MNNLYDSTQLKLIGITSRNKENHLQIKGGKGVSTWDFQGLEKGIYQLSFVYKRLWLNEIADKRIYIIKIE